MQKKTLNMQINYRHMFIDKQMQCDRKCQGYVLTYVSH